MDQVSSTNAQFAHVSPITPAQSIQVWAFGVLITLKLAGHQTGGQLSSFEDDVGPGIGAPLHYHSREDETWYMLDGELTWIVGQKENQTEYVAREGTVIFIPRGTPHGFINKAGRRSRMLVVYTPAGQETWFLEIGKPVEDRANPVPPPHPTREETMKALKLGEEKYGMVFLPPDQQPPATKDEL